MNAVMYQSVNARHEKIIGWLDRFGLAPGMDVLEVGCGDGMVTGLIAERLRGTGSLLAVDIDRERAALAAQRTASWENVAAFGADVLELEFPQGSFDVIVLPDSLEHIDALDHPRLFSKLAYWIRLDGWILIHIPNPLYLAQVTDRQVPVDEPVPTRVLLAAIEPAGLFLSHLETYPVWDANGDYQAILLRPLAAASRFNL